MIRAQLSSIKRSGHPAGMQEGMSTSLQLHKLELSILLLLLLLRWVLIQKSCIFYFDTSTFFPANYTVIKCFQYISIFPLSFYHRQSWFQDVWSSLSLPAVDSLPLNSVEDLSQDPKTSVQQWPRIVSPLLCVLGLSIAFWGSAVLRVFVCFLSFFLAPLHR